MHAPFGVARVKDELRSPALDRPGMKWRVFPVRDRKARVFQEPPPEEGSTFWAKSTGL